MTHSLKDLLSDLRAEDLTEQEIHRLAEAVAHRARAARYPLKSIAAVERESIVAGANEDLTRLIIDVARDLLDVEPAIEQRPPPGTWLTPPEAASALGVPLKWVIDQLNEPAGRRILGYPWCDGRRWHVPAAACDSNTRSSYLSSLPDAEPPENVALLRSDR